jgi:ubiquitin-protein ligase
MSTEDEIDRLKKEVERLTMDKEERIKKMQEDKDNNLGKAD